jgi:hypothetical protein
VGSSTASQVTASNSHSDALESCPPLSDSLLRRSRSRLRVCLEHAVLLLLIAFRHASLTFARFAQRFSSIPFPIVILVPWEHFCIPLHEGRLLIDGTYHQTQRRTCIVASQTDCPWNEEGFTVAVHRPPPALTIEISPPGTLTTRH